MLASEAFNYPHKKRNDSSHSDFCGNGCFSGIGARKGGVKANKKKLKDNVDDAMLAKELNELSVQERERVMEELHGVADIIKETSELVQTSCEQLTKELQKLSKTKRRALVRALFLKPSLEKDIPFKLLFLRADSFDAAKAAVRMCKYFEHKLELFGADKLVKRITLEDMNEDDMAAVHTGAVTILPQKDQAGRLIWFINQTHYDFKHWKNQVRDKLEYCII
jgi:phage-related protein